MDQRQLQIGELADVIGVSTRSLRHYEEQGLLSPARGANGYGVYGETDIARAENIKGLLDVGLAVSDVRGYLEADCLIGADGMDSVGDAACGAELETVNTRLQRLDDLINRLSATRDQLAEHAEKLRH